MRAILEDIIIKTDITIDYVWVIPKGQVVRFEADAHIHGKGTLQGGIILAPLTKQIFDTTFNVAPEAMYHGPFSAAWYGASPANPDNYDALQKSIDTVIANYAAFKDLIIPKGVYNFSKSLKMAYLYNNAYAGVTIHLYGQGGHWEANGGTVLNYTGLSGFALGGQVLKGAEIDHLSITGQFKAPEIADAAYYALDYNAFNDANGKCDYSYTGLAIDYDGTKNWSGSTAVNVHDVRISNFSFLIGVSQNGVTPNAECLEFKNIAFGDGRVGYANGQAQEKGNTITNVIAWGRLHTVFFMGLYGKSQAGNYYLRGGNIAGHVIRLISSTNVGWYTTTISDFFCESLGQVGTITSQLPVKISNCTFHFVTPDVIGYRNVVTTNNKQIEFDTCILRYYGTGYQVQTTGAATYHNCSPVVNAQATIN